MCSEFRRPAFRILYRNNDTTRSLPPAYRDFLDLAAAIRFQLAGQLESSETRWIMRKLNLTAMWLQGGLTT